MKDKTPKFQVGETVWILSNDHRGPTHKITIGTILITGFDIRYKEDSWCGKRDDQGYVEKELFKEEEELKFLKAWEAKIMLMIKNHTADYLMCQDGEKRGLKVIQERIKKYEEETDD